jgi:hypothetical protein
MKSYLPSDSKFIPAAEYHLEEPTDLYDSSVSPTDGRPITTTTRPNRPDNQLTLRLHSLVRSRLPANCASRHEQIHRTDWMLRALACHGAVAVVRLNWQELKTLARRPHLIRNAFDKITFWTLSNK